MSRSGHNNPIWPHFHSHSFAMKSNGKVLSAVSRHDELYNPELDDFLSTGGSRRGFSEF